MNSTTKNLKVFYSIIGSVMIYVMNYFRTVQFTTKMFFHHMAMFPNVPIIHSEINIFASKYPSRIPFALSSISMIPARMGTKLGSLLAVGAYFKRFFTNRTMQYDHEPIVSY